MLLFRLEEMAFMKKNKVIAIIGVLFSAVALIASTVELWYCIVHNINFLIMPILLVAVMLIVLVANIVNLVRINKYNKKFSEK